MTPVARRGIGRSRRRGGSLWASLPIASDRLPPAHGLRPARVAWGEGLSRDPAPADNSCMRSLSMRGAGLVAALVISGVLWLYGHGGGSATATSQAYCHDVDRLSSVLTDVRQ